MRNVSPAMARRLRAKGIAVEGAGQARVATPAPPPPQVKKLEDVLPPVAVTSTVKVLMPADRRAIIDDARDGLAALVKRNEKTPPLPDAPWPTQPKAVTDTGAADLTDEELERLTAPES